MDIIAGCLKLGILIHDHPAIKSFIASAAGKVSPDIFKCLSRDVAARFFHQPAGKTEVETALRHAQIAALRQILTRFNEARKTDTDAHRQAEQDDFAKAFATFLKSDKPSHFDEQILRDDILALLPEAFDTSLAARRSSTDENVAKAAILESQAQIKTVVEQAVLAEIRLRVKPATIPALFESAFLGKGFADGWFDCFTRAAADGLKEGTEFATLWQAEQQAIIKAIADAHTAMLAEIKADTGEIKEDTKAIRQELREANAKIDLILVQFDKSEKAQEAKDSGLESQTIIALAQRLKPSETLNINQALIELENAVTIAIEVIARGERGSNDEAFINDVLKRVAALTLAGQFDKGAQEIDAALAEIDRQEAEQKDTTKRRRITMLEAGIQQDTLRRDAKAVAKRIEALVRLEDYDERNRWVIVYNYWYKYHTEDDKKGNNLFLEIAIELGRILISLAYDTYTRGAAQNYLGIALRILGKRKGDTTLLNDAVTAHRDALKEYTQKREPLDWAMSQNNLGNALQALGESLGDTALLNNAIAAYREALKEWTRKRVPLKWAGTQYNLGTALQELGARKGDTALLNDAVTAYRKALKERTRDRVPIHWAMTQNNLGNALLLIGARERGTARLEEAATAYRRALEEFTQEHTPLDWNIAQKNLALCLALIKARS